MVGLETIYRDGKPAGFLRRAEYGYAIDSTISYGYVSNLEKPDQTIDLKYVKVSWEIVVFNIYKVILVCIYNF